MNVVVTGAAGQIANHLLFMLASGEVFGKDQPIALHLLGSERSREAVEGVAMELEDSLYPLLRQVMIGTDPMKVFVDADWAILMGPKPRGPGMERADLLDIKGQIFQEQGRALNAVAPRDCKMMVVGNPCNTNALIGMENAPDIPRKNWHALTRLDENRAKCQLGLKAGKFYTSVTNMCVWGNHSTTQVPDFVNAKIGGKRAPAVIRDTEWLKEVRVDVDQRRPTSTNVDQRRPTSTNVRSLFARPDSLSLSLSLTRATRFARSPGIHADGGDEGRGAD